MTYIIVKKYDHFNRALNKHISSKKQYDEEMKRGGFVSYEEGSRLADENKDKLHKPYKASEQAVDLLKSARLVTDRKGKIEVGSKMLDAMKKVGYNPVIPDWVPKHYLDIK